MKYALVTGGSRGIGRAACVKLAKMGYNILINYRSNNEAAEETRRLVEAEGKTAVLMQFDVADGQAVKEVLATWMETNKETMSIEVLVNNAGILRDKSFHKMSVEDFNLVMQVHFEGTLNCTHTVFPVMREQAFGRIIFTSSSSGVFGNFGQSNYGSAKMAMIGLMNTLIINDYEYNYQKISSLADFLIVIFN